MHEPSDVLDLLLAEILEREVELVANLVVYYPADANPPGIGQCLQPRRNIDAFSEDVVLFDDHIAEIDANPKPDALRPARRLR